MIAVRVIRASREGAIMCVNARIRSALLAILAISLLGSCGRGSNGTGTRGCDQPGTSCRHGIDGRAYELYLPTTFEPHSSALVVALHPLGSSGAHMSRLTGLNSKAEEAGFAVAYPDASGKLDGVASWTKYHQSGPDDIDFLRRMIAQVQSTIQPDPRKVYVTGYSDGAAMTHRVGAELSDLVAAIAPVEGTLFYALYRSVPVSLSAIPPTVAPVSVLIVHGDLEPENSIPYCNDDAGVGMATQEMGFNYWAGATANSCAMSSSSMPLCEGSVITASTTKTASSCLGGVEVKIYRVQRASHGFWNVSGAWSTRLDDPRRSPYQPDWSAATGATTNDVVWSFFAAHPKP
jgi:polyhydroxybutyrate depolymerase